MRRNVLSGASEETQRAARERCESARECGNVSERGAEAARFPKIGSAPSRAGPCVPPSPHGRPRKLVGRETR